MTSAHETARPTPAHERLAICLVLLLTGLLYLPGINGPFLHDDFPRIASNERVTIDQINWEALKQSAGEYPARPLAMMSFAMAHAACGPQPACQKAPNVILHLLCGIALWFFLKELQRSLKTRTGTQMPPWLPLAATTLWLLHPLNVSTVLYAVQRMSQMAALFSLLTMFAWLKARNAPGEGKPKVVWIIVAGLLLIPGLLSKESAWLALPLIALLEVLLLTPAQRAHIIPRPVLSGWAIALLALFGLWLMALYPPDFIRSSYVSREFTPVERLFTQSRVLLYYVSELFWPDPRRMSLFLDTFELSSSLLSPPTTLAALAILFTASGVSMTAILRGPSLAAFGVLFFLGAHSLESSLIGLVPAYEHRNYLAGIGLIVAACSLSTRLVTVSWRKYLLGTGMLAASSVLVLMLGSRVITWSTPDGLSTALMDPRWERSYAGNILVAQYADLLHDQHPTDPILSRLYAKQAITHYERAARASTQPFAVLVELIVRSPPYSLATAGYWDELEKAGRNSALNPDTVVSASRMVSCLLARSCAVDPQRVADYLDTLLANSRQSATTRWRLERIAGTFYTKLHGDADKGLKWARRAAKSGHPDALESLIKNLAYAGHLEEARDAYARLGRTHHMNEMQQARIEAEFANATKDIGGPSRPENTESASQEK